MKTDDDNWELFVPVIGERYPDVYQVRHRVQPLGWREGMVPGGIVYYPDNHLFEYRKPKQKQKENKMPDRTPQQALKDAIESGAVEAWINGEPIEANYRDCGWAESVGSGQCFSDPDFHWRPTPPEPTKIGWRPVVKGKEPKGVVLGYWGDGMVITEYIETPSWQRWRNPVSKLSHSRPSHWAPMCNLPEGDK